MSQSQNPEVIALSRRLELLASISDDALASVARDVETRLVNLGCGTGAIDREQLVMLKGAGVNPQTFAEDAAKRKAAEKTVASIDPESLVILKIMHGSDVVVLADKWRQIQKLNGKTKASR
jgi:cell division protein ZapA (FtsZ GTPase activity inhibitor)